ncbi:hypothetical protein [Kitasatospora sp. NPDC050543]|uniref:hypothetical protein n=1 Tax=Kitasatospora sp. NPDC050543 TaxID=3364054 RepID=UPI00379E76E8
MGDTERDHSLAHAAAHAASGAARLWSGGALVRHQIPLAVVGLACVAVGIVVAVVVPESDGPAWVMAVVGCLAAGVMLLGRIAFAVFRARRGVTL